jgi:hypothetical protein
LSDSFGLVNFSKLNILGYTTPTISLAVYFGGRLQLWSGVQRLNDVFWVRESAIRCEFSARMNAPCGFTTHPAASNDLIMISQNTFLKLSGTFCTYLLCQEEIGPKIDSCLKSTSVFYGKSRIRSSTHFVKFFAALMESCCAQITESRCSTFGPSW